MSLERRMEHHRDEDRGRRCLLPAPAEPSSAAGLVIGCRDGALGEPGAEEKKLRRLALRLVQVRLSEAAPEVLSDRLGRERVRCDGAHRVADSTRTALTLNSGVPISGSPTSCVSQFTFCSAKCSAIQTRPGKTRSVMCAR